MATPRSEPSPTPVGADGIDEDVLTALSAANNELMSMHRELARTSAELAQLNRRKDEILGRVAHDLRNPLGAVAGFASTLERLLDDVLDEQARSMFRRITRQAERMQRMVDDLLDASAIERGALTLELGDADLRPLVAEVAERHAAAASAKGVPLVADVPDEPVVVRADADRIAQVLDNLVSNAVKFSPADAGATVTVRSRTEDAVAVIRVADEGPGVPIDERERIFVPFERAAARPTGAERSTGLGLAITRSIVSAHGGSVTVTETPGGGACFEVRLPTSGPVVAEGG
jgi:signal transduction histidine kinase